MAEVAVGERQPAVPYLPPHDVVLHIVLTVAPGDRAVVVLLETHHDAAVPDRVDVKKGIRLQVPADFTLRVRDPVHRFRGPLQCAAFGAVPDRFPGAARDPGDVIHVVEPVGKFAVRRDSHRGSGESGRVTR